jgi:plastocyanin
MQNKINRALNARGENHMFVNRILAVVFLFSLLVPLPGRAELHIVNLGNNFFQPNDLTIKAGDTVRWVNNSTHLHDVVPDNFSWSSPQSTSFVYERTFNTVGEVLYHCTVHSLPGRNIANFMNGRLNVEEGDPGPEFLINAGISDAWYNPATNGQGFFIIVWEDIEQIFLSWFTFETERPPANVAAVLGEPGHRWLTALGPYLGDTATLDIYMTEGGVFDSANPPAEDAVDVGNITITWTDCNVGELSYDMPSLGLSGDIPIQRLVSDNVAACEAAQPAAQR